MRQQHQSEFHPVDCPARILRTTGAAGYVGLSPSTLEKKRLSGGGPKFIRLGGRAVGYDVRDLDDWLDQQRQFDPNNAATKSRG